MQKSAIFDIIKNLIIKRLGVDTRLVTPKAKFIHDLGLDSLDYAELIMEFETTFDINIPDEDTEGIVFVSDAVDYVHQKLSAKSSKP